MASELKLSFKFDRYINGTLMAEGVTIERVSTLDKAMVVAARIAPKGPNGETPVLVYLPAPVATDTGLETVEYQVRSKLNGHWVKDNFLSQQLSPDTERRELVTRSQAEELLSAKDARIAAIEADNAAEREKGIVQAKHAELTELKERWLKEMVTAITSSPIGSPKHLRAVEYARRALNSPEASLYALYEKEELIQRVEKAEAHNAALIHDLNRIKDHETELVNDNVAQAARIKELDRCHEGTIDLCNQKTAQIEALEAKLEAAEKALELIDKAVSEGRFIRIRKIARAVLGGKP